MTIWRRISGQYSRYAHCRNARTTLRYMFPAFLGSVAAFSLLALSGSATDSSAYIDTPTQAVEVGAIFPVTIYTSAALPINAVEMKLTFPSDKIEVFGVDRGQSVITIWTQDPVVTSTAVELRGGTFKRGFLGEHQIATVNFRAKETGHYNITLEDVRLVAGDGGGTEIPALAVEATKLSLFNFDETTSEEELRVAVVNKLNTDITGDGTITLQDISAFMGAWSSRTETHDFNGDGRMTFRDFSIILADFFFQ